MQLTRSFFLLVYLGLGFGKFDLADDARRVPCNHDIVRKRFSHDTAHTDDNIVPQRDPRTDYGRAADPDVVTDRDRFAVPGRCPVSCN